MGADTFSDSGLGTFADELRGYADLLADDDAAKDSIVTAAALVETYRDERRRFANGDTITRRGERERLADWFVANETMLIAAASDALSWPQFVAFLLRLDHDTDSGTTTGQRL